MKILRWLCVLMALTALTISGCKGSESENGGSDAPADPEAMDAPAE